MKSFRSAPLAASIALLVFGAGLGSANAQALPSDASQRLGQPMLAATSAATMPSRFVRVPAAQGGALGRLALSPRYQADYGSFRWLELDESDYQTLVASGAGFQEEPASGQLQINRFRFDPRVDGEPPVGQRTAGAGEGAGFRLVQFRGPVKSEWLGELERSGLEPLQYYPGNAYLVWGEPQALARAESLSFVRWQGQVHPAYKPSQSLDRRNGMIRNVDVMFYGEAFVDSTLAAIEKAGGRVLNHYPAQPDRKFFNAIVELPSDAIAAVADIDNVLWMGFQDSQPIFDDEMSVQIQAGNHPGGVPVVGYENHLVDLGFDGTGVTWAIIDSGIDYDHADLAGRIVGGYSFPGACNPAGQPGSDCSGGGHGTHVAGIVAGDATLGLTDTNGFLYGLGVAPGAGLFAMNSLSASAWPPSGGWQEHSKRAVLGGAIGTNNSWTTGEGTNHGYQASERTHDIMARDGNFDTAGVAEPFIQVFSAGNSGTSGLTAPKEAKNVIVTASSRNYRVGSVEDISSFSSRGPAADGRQVPTIAAPGEQIASARNDTGGSCTGGSSDIGGTGSPARYSYCSGTSMASPHAAGAVVLLTEWWRSVNAGATPSPAMAKALLVNNAIDMAGNTAARWNTLEGWGRVNITNIIQPGVPAEYWDQTEVLTATGQTHQVTVGVADPGKPVRITLAWTDAPGAAGANPALVNNLDLSVADGATTYLGNVFSGGWSSTGGTADNRNNLENVFIQNPSGAALTITVAATSLAGDGVPFSGTATDQDFALVCTNCALAPDFTLATSPLAQDICAPDSASYAIDVGQVLAFGNPVSLSVSGEPAGATASLSLTSVTPPGSSTLTIANTAAAAAGSYTLSIDGTATGGTPKTSTVALNLFSAVPAAAGLATPANGATGVSVTPSLTWGAATQAATYTIQIATDAGFGNIVATTSGLAATQWSAPLLSPFTTYYWRVKADNTCGEGGWSNSFTFTTGNPPFPQPYCDVTFPSAVEPITLVDFAGINNTSSAVVGGSPPLENFTAIQGNVQVGGIYAMTVKGNTYGNYSTPVRVYIDWNKDGNFANDATEGYTIGTLTNSTGTDTKQVTANITVPTTALPGATRMRVVKKYSTAADPCNNSGYGQAEDYTLVVGTGEPGITVVPAALGSSQATDVSTSHPLTITNTGGAVLNWVIGEADASVGGVPVPSMAGGNPGDHSFLGGGGACSTPSDAPWLNVTPASGATTVGASSVVAVVLDSASLAPGSYDASLCVTSNDPTNPLVVVPVSLTVEAPPQPEIFGDGFEN